MTEAMRERKAMTKQEFHAEEVIMKMSVLAEYQGKEAMMKYIERNAELRDALKWKVGKLKEEIDHYSAIIGLIDKGIKLYGPKEAT
jgi:hypothetical protein